MKPKKLILYHTLYWGRSDEEIIKEIRENFDGDLVVANDLEYLIEN